MRERNALAHADQAEARDARLGIEPAPVVGDLHAHDVVVERDVDPARARRGRAWRWLVSASCTIR